MVMAGEARHPEASGSSQHDRLDQRVLRCNDSFLEPPRGFDPRTYTLRDKSPSSRLSGDCSRSKAFRPVQTTPDHSSSLKLGLTVGLAFGHQEADLRSWTSAAPMRSMRSGAGHGRHLQDLDGAHLVVRVPCRERLNRCRILVYPDATHPVTSARA
jgi:hypothetical protein